MADGSTIRRVYKDAANTETVYDAVASVPGGPIDTPLATPAANKTAAVFPFSRKPPFKLSGQKGKALRAQGMSHKTKKPGDTFVRWINYRIMGVVGNPSYQEDLRKLLAKGFTHFRFDNVLDNERTATGGFFKRGIYGDLGTNNSNHNHDSVMTLHADLNDLYTMMASRLPVLNTDQTNSTTEFINLNVEFYWFNIGKEPQYRNLVSWENLTDAQKNQTFYSYYSRSNKRIIDIFNEGGGGQGGIELLNQHLFAKRRVFHIMCFQKIRQLNPGRAPKITNGDEFWFKDPVVNGTITVNGTELSLLDYENESIWTLDRMKAMHGFAGNTSNGGTKTFPDGVTLNLDGHVYDFYDYFSKYYYYFNFHIKTSDYNELMNTQDPAKLTSEYWRSKFFPDRTAPYWSAVSWCLHRRFFQLLKDREGKNYLDKPVFDMWEMMLEGNETFIVPDNMDELDAYSDQHGTAFMPFVETALTAEGLTGHQKMLIMRELVFIRVWVARLLYDGYFQWWEGRPTGFSGVGVSFAEGKYKHFSPCVTEEDQEAFDEIEQYNQCLGPGATKILKARLRFKIGENGAWSDWYNNVDPVRAMCNRENNQWKFLPMIIRSRTADINEEVIYIGGWFRRNETVYVEYADSVNASITRTAKVKGYMPTLQYLNRTLNTLVTSGTYDSSVASTYNTQQPI